LKEQFEESVFDVHAFNDKMRQSFKNQLRPFCKISPADLQDSISMHLKNPGIHHEIQSAKKTYADAKQFVSQIEAEKLA